LLFDLPNGIIYSLNLNKDNQLYLLNNSKTVEKNQKENLS